MSKIYKEDRGFFGRRLGRPLSAAKQDALDTLLEQCAITEGSTPLSLPQDRKVILEIGFGYGERLAEMMRREPEHYYIGIEPFINGMAAFANDLISNPPSSILHPSKGGGSLNNVKAGGGMTQFPTNLSVYMNDVVPFLKRIPDESIDILYILNPDPWHKTRHHKRRIVGPDNLPEFARILKKGGRFITTTDAPYLAEWMVSHTLNYPAFTWTASSKADWENPPKGWIHTRYETKGAKGAHKMGYYIFERTP